MRIMMLTVVLLSFATVASADVIDQIKNPFSTSNVSGGTSAQSMFDTDSGSQFGLAYDNFSFAVDRQLLQIDWVGAYDGAGDIGGGVTLTHPDLIDPSFTIGIWSDGGGEPGAAALATINVAPLASNETLVVPTGGEEFFYSYSADISSEGFVAAAGQQYWLSISATMDFQENGWGLAFSEGTSAGDDLSVNDFNGTRFVDASDYAIRFTAVPEPSSAALVLLCCGGLSFRRRRAG